MTFYTQKEKRKLRDDVLTGINTLAKCWNFVTSLDYALRDECTIELLEKEYSELLKLKKRLNHSIYNGLDIEIEPDELLLCERWCYTNYNVFKIEYIYR